MSCSSPAISAESAQTGISTWNANSWQHTPTLTLCCHNLEDRSSKAIFPTNPPRLLMRAISRTRLMPMSDVAV